MQFPLSLLFATDILQIFNPITIIIIIIKSKHVWIFLSNSSPRRHFSMPPLPAKKHTANLSTSFRNDSSSEKGKGELLEGSGSWVETIFSIDRKFRRRKEKRKEGRKRDVATAKTRLDSTRLVEKSEEIVGW